LGAQEKVPKEKGGPVHSSACADALRSSPVRGRAQLAISRCSMRSNRVRALIPDGLRYSVSANGNRVAGFGVDFGFDVQPRLALPSIAVKTGTSSRPV